jgi:hypothetical protein
MSEFNYTSDLVDLDRGDDIPDDGAAAAAEAAAKAAEEEAAKLKAEEDAKAAKGEDDGDEGADETEEEKVERLAAEEAAQKKSRSRIPLSRHEEVLRTAREKAEKREAALVEQIRALQAGRTENQQRTVLKDMTDKIEELQDKYEDLVLDGKRDEARAVRREVTSLQEQVNDYRTATVSAQTRNAAIETLKFEAALASAESDYPQINPDHPDAFDEDLTHEVAELTDSLVKAKKMARHEAFAKAVRYVLGPPKKIDEQAKDAKAAADLAAQRALDARKKAADAANKQAPDGTKAGKDNDKGGDGGNGELDVLRLSQEKFAKLDEETKSRMRGDTV